MFTKSKIQQIRESIDIKNNFKDGLNNLMEKYNIVDSIFVSCNGQAKEVTRGYFTVKGEYDSIDEALSNCDLGTDGVRIMENKKFQTGYVCGILSGCPKEGKILDITQIEYIR